MDWDVSLEVVGDHGGKLGRREVLVEGRVMVGVLDDVHGVGVQFDWLLLLDCLDLLGVDHLRLDLLVELSTVLVVVELVWLL